MAQTPPIPFDVRAIAPYAARNANEVSLEVGKVYRVLATDGRGVWWQSKTDDGGVGWFPANYTQIEVSAAPPTPEPVDPVTPHIPQLPQQALQQSVSTPAVVTPQQPQTPVSPQSSNSFAGSSNGNHSVPSERGAPQKSNLDPALKQAPPIKDPCVLTVHVVESVHNTLPIGKSPNFFIYKRQIIDRDPKKLKPLFNIANKTKAGPWKWNEEYKLYIKDAELEVVGLRFCVKNDFKCKGKDLLGEIEFPLRGAVRKFDKPNGIFQWFPLKVGNDKSGEALVFIEYCDPRPFSGPSDVQHKGHVGITSAGGFEIRDIPQEWKQLFRILNIKKKDLENNAQLASEVFDIMQKAVSEGVIPGSGELPSRPAHSEEVNNNHHQHSQVAPSPPPVPTVHSAAIPSSNHNHSYPATPSVPQPPPVPMVTQPSHSAPAPPPPPVSTGPKPPPPPAPISNSNKPAGGGMSLLEQIQRGTTLKTAQVKEVQAGTASTGNPLADTLLSAMSKYRVDIEGKDEDGDDWD